MIEQQSATMITIEAPSQLGRGDAHLRHNTIPFIQAALGSWRFSVERVPFQEEEVTAIYDRIAATWNRRLSTLRYHTTCRKLMERLLTDGPLTDLPEGAWVLDAGTGTGALSLALHEQYERNREGVPLMFSAVDRSRSMLNIARAAFDEEGLDVSIKEADVCNLPHESNAFDLVMAGHVIEHLPEPTKAVKELVRVLQPGAPLVLLVTRRSFLGALVQLNWRIHRPGEQELKKWLETYGLTDIECVELNGTVSRHLSIACVGRKKS